MPLTRIAAEHGIDPKTARKLRDAPSEPTVTLRRRPSKLHGHTEWIPAAHFFRLICERYERGSIILTSNKRFSDWGELIGDETLADAILDRLLHHATTINISGPSYRLKEKRRAGILEPARRKGASPA